MQINSEALQLINHASINIKLKNCQLLSDPWYEGSAFNNGWNLLYENKEKEIKNLLNSISHIFISHEHPDHFSISFFKRYAELIKYKKIIIIFQETIDKRVENFLKKLDLKVITPRSWNWFNINEKIRIKIIPCGTIDSAIIIESENFTYINLNDCDFSKFELIKIRLGLNKIKPRIVLNQFSYAAYRGTKKWMKHAGSFKIKNLAETYRILNAELCIPFASFIYFSHKENFFLNQGINKTKNVNSYLNKKKINNAFLNIYPKQYNVSKLILDFNYRKEVNNDGVKFWSHCFNTSLTKKNSKLLKSEPPFSLKSEPLNDKEKLNFIKKIKKDNNIYLMKIINLITFNKIFGKINIFINDLNESYEISFKKISKNFIKKKACDIAVSSDSFKLLINTDYGLDTLSVNGRLEELKYNGFQKLVWTLGFITLNSSGYGVKFLDLFNFRLLYRIISLSFRIILKKS
jgi:UDP-MurNAc hydroxylase